MYNLYMNKITGGLYIVGTPIGNLEDITLRAIEVLKSSDLILAEDTRVTKKLLAHLGFDKEILTYNEHTDIGRVRKAILVLSNGGIVSLVSDAGTPGVSDPGNEFVDFVRNNLPDIKIVPIPGASSLTALLSIAGINSNRFIFYGFFPKKGKGKIWEMVESLDLPFIFFESPMRISKTLLEIDEYFGQNKEVIIGRELTKIYEGFYKGFAKDLLGKLSSNEIPSKGEFIVLLSSVIK